MTTPSLHTALQREREAVRRLRDVRVAPAERAALFDRIEAAQRATDQALAALEERPTLAEVEAAVESAAGVTVHWREADVIERILTALRALYALGGE